ncbi:hypothetical protein CRG98_032628 [Punica granatum]|uniref:Cupin type-1 domain-containing protein n=1 Tax=Punica granatum TaxID=22663 RepID=A0A2I0ITE5_PUNGR|nr:hypothetical protein CRG98_032628 [Punica granatum]
MLLLSFRAAGRVPSESPGVVGVTASPYRATEAVAIFLKLPELRLLLLRYFALPLSCRVVLTGFSRAPSNSVATVPPHCCGDLFVLIEARFCGFPKLHVVLSTLTPEKFCDSLSPNPKDTVHTGSNAQSSITGSNDPTHTECAQPEYVFINGKLCKNPNLTVADDFLFREINIPLDTNNNAGSIVTMVAIDQLPGLNTLGISLARIDYAPYGLNPRATEVIMCVQGELQNPGVITIANAEFESKPPINSKVLTKAFQVDKKIIDYLQSQFWYNNHS